MSPIRFQTKRFHSNNTDYSRMKKALSITVIHNALFACGIAFVALGTFIITFNRYAITSYDKPMLEIDQIITKATTDQAISFFDSSNLILSNADVQKEDNFNRSVFSLMATTIAAHNTRSLNGFHYKINTNNERNEFDNNTSTTTTTTTDNITPATILLLSSSKEAISRDDFALQEEPLLSRYHQQQLLPHRQKRYLVFPESSSFQLIFDLIIGIVDYSSFAILGITCAVAWELPSKPPSEIVEDIKLRLNEGTLGVISRRNDSTQLQGQQLEYVATNAQMNEILSGSKSKVPPAALWYYPEVPAALKAASQRKPNAKPVVIASGFQHSSADINKYNGYGYASSMRHDSPPLNPLSYAEYAANSYDHYRRSHKRSRRAESGDSILLKTHSIHKGNSKRDRLRSWRNFMDWSHVARALLQREESPQKTKSKNSAESSDSYRNWSRRKPDKLKPRKRMSESFASFHVPHGRHRRRLLKARPQHRIHRVFGGEHRQVRHTFSGDFDAKLHRLNRKEHLRTRQQLFGKVARLLKARGLNGTECVLRALCETSQRSHVNEPETFITELLRTIFTLPPDLDETDREADAFKVAAHYKDANAQATDCARRYALCEVSIWDESNEPGVTGTR